MDLPERSYKSFKSRYGHFSQDGFEYIITRPDTPKPWTNIISNGDFGLAISQAGGGFSWRTHVSLNRLTRWNQDMVRDDWGKWLYLRDLDSGDFRSLAFQPVQADYDYYRVRHGLGYTVFEQGYQGLETQWTLFAAKDDPLEIWICTLRNNSGTIKNLQLASYLEWNLGAGPDINREFHKIFIHTEFEAQSRTLFAGKRLWEVPSERGHWNTIWPYVGFHAVSEKVAGWDADREKLIGRNGSYTAPQGIRRGRFSERSGSFQDAAASLAVNVQLQQGDEKTLIYVLGQADRGQEEKNQIAARLVEKYCHAEAAGQELEKVKTFWRELTGRVQISTPDDAFDLLTNVWLKYQAISAHLWGRTGYYQQSGAYGFRDQLQTSQVWLPLQPQRMLEHAKLNARHQFRDGTVLHWWHPLTEKGLPTEMTDDLLWLPFMLVRYLYETADFDCLDEPLPFYDGDQASLQDHCNRAIDKALSRFSPRGLPLIGAGDWCDGFSAVGLDWKGESVWLGMFLYDLLNKWAEVLNKYSPQKDQQRAADYLKRAEKLKAALNEHAWNGQWYIAATRDDGTPIGDPSQQECKIYLMSQTWAVISGVAEGDRLHKITEAMFGHLESDNGFMLFSPAFSVPDPYVGYITRYAPGLRENGGVYTHASTWGVMALAGQGMGDDALRIYQKLNPILQVEKDADRYSAEPYCLPGNIDGRDSEYYGRAGWTWYTGSAGWLFTIALESICGLQPRPQGLQIVPALPAGWEQISIQRRFRGAEYDITIRNPHKRGSGAVCLTVDGREISGNIVPAFGSGRHSVIAVISRGERDD